MVFAAVKGYFEPTYVVEVRGKDAVHTMQLSKSQEVIARLFRDAYELANESNPTADGHLGKFMKFELDGLTAEYRLTIKPALAERVTKTLAPAIRPALLAISGIAAAAIVHYTLLGNGRTEPYYADVLKEGLSLFNQAADWLKLPEMRA